MKKNFIMLDYPAIAAVAAVIREGAFERGAAALGITPSAVSQRVRGLEERLGAILIVRGNPCQPTELGRRLCSHLDRVRLLEHDLAPALGRGLAEESAPLTLRVAVNADSLATWFPAAIAAFGRGTGASLDLILADEAQTADKLRSGEVLAAVTSDAEPAPGCRTSPLGRLRYAACASPFFMERYFPNGVSGPALAGAPQLRFNKADRLQSRWAQQAHGVEPMGRTHWIPSTQGFIDLALESLGWGMHPLALAAPHLATGRLVELAPAQQLDVQLNWTVARLHSASLDRLSIAVREAAQCVLRPDDR